MFLPNCIPTNNSYTLSCAVFCTVQKDISIPILTFKNGTILSNNLTPQVEWRFYYNDKIIYSTGVINKSSPLLQFNPTSSGMAIILDNQMRQFFQNIANIYLKPKTTITARIFNYNNGRFSKQSNKIDFYV